MKDESYILARDRLFMDRLFINVHLLDSLQCPHVDILADKTSIDSAVLFTGKKLLSKIINKKNNLLSSSLPEG